MATLHEQRARIAPLLDTTSPADAPTAYYALYHDPNRSSLYVQTDAEGQAIGFVGRFQTGVDLFRPVVCLRCPTPEVAADLLAQALIVGRPYLLFSGLDQLPMVGGSMQTSNERVLSIYALDPARFTLEINVLVVTKTAPDGTPRAEIHSNGLQAVAGVNWQSPHFAEIYVHTEPEARQRGWARSVAAACTERVLSSGRLPTYLVEQSNEASVRLAESLGYVDTGAKQVFADVVYTGHPARMQQETQ
jgi:ribosomal protein S18 acetylase RimI-like enzyme